MKRDWGFTLIEILIALAVFAILATITSSSMYNAFNTHARVTKQSDRLISLQLAITLLTRDTEQITIRSVRGDDMHLFPSFIGRPDYMEFTRGGIANPKDQEKRSTLIRIAYLCSKDQLIRRTWIRIDTPKRAEFQDKVLVNNMTSCAFAYLDAALQVLDEWRASEEPQPNQPAPPPPKAVRVTFTLSDWGNASLLFTIPEGVYAKS